MQTVPCPQCGKRVTWQHNDFRPFCSERCRMLDLGAWASEDYAIPGEPAETSSPTDDEASEA